MKRYGGLGATYGSIFDDTSEIVSDILNDKIEKSTTVTELNINDIEPNREQPRKFFSEEKLSELADSIKTHGLLQPVVVRVKDGGYQIISGERRWRAAKLAGVRTLPVRVVDADDITVLQLALVENLQREDLNPLEEAEGYQLLASKFDMTQE
ncbi:MAG: ParB/RepB/Spo0J family partition protein, partial [Oscillospiraceae bacterium]|nr:ParB/RepB/Spo0J family partition protein [Oscillospiraceae bacterium]